MTAVLDASALLAWLQEESGADQVRPLLAEGIVTAANWSEVLQKANQHGAHSGEVAALLLALGLSVVDITQAEGETAAGLWRRIQPLSLGDRLCLAAALRLGLPAVTAEAAWVALGDEIQLEIRLIR